MTDRRPSAGERAGWRRTLRRERDGSLFDIEERRAIDPEDLLDELRAGRRFRAHRTTGEDCTVEVLVEALVPALGGHLLEQGGVRGPLFPPGPLSLHLGKHTTRSGGADHDTRAPRAPEVPVPFDHV